MEKKLRSILIKFFGFERYLSLVSHIYLWVINQGLLKLKYPELFFLKKIIKPGDVCIDIGANVGYYSAIMSQSAGTKGKIISIEPVSVFAQIFKKNVKRWGINNITLHEVAFGAQEGRLQMGTPLIDGVLRHGLTHVITEGENTAGMMVYDVPVVVPDVLLSEVPKIDFVKCDVEGYEVFLFPLFLNTLAKHKPLLQIEITGSENINEMLKILSPLGYKPYRLSNEELQKLTHEQALVNTTDFYFIAESA